MIFLFLLSLARVQAAPLESESTADAISNVESETEISYSSLDGRAVQDGLQETLIRTEYLKSQNITEKHNGSESACHQSLDIPPNLAEKALRKVVQDLLEPWNNPPLTGSLTSVVIPGMVINHGKVADMGRLVLLSVTQELADDGFTRTNLTVVHGDLKITYKYNLDGPKGRLEVKAPARMYFINLESGYDGSLCKTVLHPPNIRLHKEEDLEFSARGESEEDAYPLLEAVKHQLNMESRSTAFYNIRSVVIRELMTSNPPLCMCPSDLNKR